MEKGIIIKATQRKKIEIYCVTIQLKNPFYFNFLTQTSNYCISEFCF